MAGAEADRREAGRRRHVGTAAADRTQSAVVAVVAVVVEGEAVSRAAVRSLLCRSAVLDRSSLAAAVLVSTAAVAE